MYDPEALVRLAIVKARAGILPRQTPFGCAIVRDNELSAVEHHTVWATTDVTAHAEINALRSGCRAAHRVHLTGAIVVTTCEPRPRCMSPHEARALPARSRVPRVVCGMAGAARSTDGLNTCANVTPSKRCIPRSRWSRFRRGA